MIHEDSNNKAESLILDAIQVSGNLRDIAGVMNVWVTLNIVSGFYTNSSRYSKTKQCTLQIY